VAVGSTAVFRLPHAAPLSSVSGAREGITTDSSDSTTLWIGSNIARPVKELRQKKFLIHKYFSLLQKAIRKILRDTIVILNNNTI
jgi:hypothetical protein